MHSVLRPNYRRARALALEIEAARVHLDEARGDPSYTLDDIEDLKAELHHLEREFSLTGVTSEGALVVHSPVIVGGPFKGAVRHATEHAAHKPFAKLRLNHHG